jgi:limonene 1,2-monooxygenase
MQLDHIWIVGDPAEVTDRLQRLRDEVGGFGTLLVIGQEWDPRPARTRSMRLLAERVLPRR